MPLTLVVKRPDGVEYKRVSVADQGLGGRSLAVPLAAGAAPGTWTIDAYADPKAPAIGHVEFLLEDYVPERLDFTLKTGQKIVDARRADRGLARCALPLWRARRRPRRHRRDPPAGGRRLGDRRAIPAIVGGLADDEFTAVENQFPEKVQTDAKGHADLSIDLPEGDAAKPLEAKIIVDVAESGGRTVERVVTLPVRAKGATIGVKEGFRREPRRRRDRDFRGDRRRRRRRAHSAQGRDLVALSAQQRLSMVSDRRALELRAGQVVAAHRRRRRRHRRRRAGQDRRAGRLGPPSARPQIARRRADQHHLRRRLVGHGERRHARQRRRHARQGRITRPASKPSCASPSRAAGKATIALVGDKLEQIHRRRSRTRATMSCRSRSAPIGARAPMRSRSRIARSTSKAKRMPGRAIGLAWFSIDAAARKLDIAIGAPEKTRPRETLEAADQARRPRARRGGGGHRRRGRHRHSQPDAVQDARPERLLLRPAQARVEIRDLYGLLIDGMEGVAGAICRPAATTAAISKAICRRSRRSRCSPASSRSAPMERRRSASTFPAFNGSVRVMALAWSKSKVGSAEANVIVRDPVVVTATLPRFLNLGDRSQMHVDIDNVEGEAGDYRLDLDIHGPLSARGRRVEPRRCKLAAHQRALGDDADPAAGVGTAGARSDDYRARASPGRSISRSASRRARPTYTKRSRAVARRRRQRDDLRRV